MQNNDIKTLKTENTEEYFIHIDNFDGPLGLLWELIKKAKIDITEVSISSITEQYIDFINYMEELNTQLAIEFIWMASELLFYKSKALLPSDEIDDEYFTPPLPPELIEKLLEYKIYQRASFKLKEEFEIRANNFTRENRVNVIEDKEEYLDVSLFDLLEAFTNVLESLGEVDQDEIIFDEIMVSDRIEFISDLLKNKKVVLFTEIFPSESRHAVVIASFLAILEMAKTRVINVLQYSYLGDIRITRK